MESIELGVWFRGQILEPMKKVFVAKDEIIDLLGLGLVARENLFILGPPGTAKSAIVQDMASRIDGRVFDYLLTRFTEPNEIFGPFDIRRLRDGELKTNTEGMLPEAAFVFLDELLNANSAILNSLLMVLNERVFRRGRETFDLPTLMVVGASNHLPEDEALAALFDRFLLRVRSDNVVVEELTNVLAAGWELEKPSHRDPARIGIDEMRNLQQAVGDVNLSPVIGEYVELIRRLRHAGLAISDRRAVKVQRLVAASALLSGRLTVNMTDLWPVRYIWDTEEQIEILNTIVQATVDPAIEQATGGDGAIHERARAATEVNAEAIARDLSRMEERVQLELSETDRSYARDQLGLLQERAQWITDEQQRTHVEALCAQLWNRLETG